MVGDALSMVIGWTPHDFVEPAFVYSCLWHYRHHAFMDKQFVLRAKKKDGHLDANDHCLLCCSGIGCTHGHADGTVHSTGFTLRFVYQWYYSYRRHVSLLPLGFWIISLIGSGTIVIYGIIRRAPVLILGQSFGLVAYVRNIVLLSRQRKSDGQ